MCKKRELTEGPLINRVRQSINERSIQTLLQKQLAIMALIDTTTITMDPETGKEVFQEIVSIMKELKDIDAMGTCGLN